MIKKQSFRKLEISTKQEKENYRETAPYLECRATTVCMHLRRTTQGIAQENFFTNLASQQTKTKFYFPSQDGKQNLNFGRSPLNHYRLLFGNGFFNCDLICNVWKFCKDRTFAHGLFTDFPRMIWAVNPFWDPFYSFQSLWIVAFGIFTSPRIFSFYSPRFQRIVANCPVWSTEH